MDLQMFAKRYLGMTKVFASITGIWPYQNQYQKNIRRALVNSVVIVALICQIGKIVVFLSIRTVVDQIPFLMVAIGSFIKYSNYVLNDNKFKKLFNSVLGDWQEVKTQEEERLMQKYANRGVLFILIYNLNIYFCVTTFLLLPFMPRLMDVWAPLNESRPRIHMYPGYYFTKNDDDYYYLIMLYTTISMLFAMCVFIASDTIMIYMVQHVCGLLSLAGYRFKSSMDGLSSWTDDYKVHERTYKKVCYAIKAHKRAYAFLNEIEDAYTLNLFIQVGFAVLTFTITLLKVASITWSLDTYPYYGFVIVQLVHVFFLTVQGQFVIDLHDSLYLMEYEAYWYNGDIKTQALFVLIIRRNLTPPLLTAGGLIHLNLNSFAEVNCKGMRFVLYCAEIRLNVAVK
ncbi:unnamed protein product [Xylocopa violacea]|uniref:Odorant receptor n=1 Tax=Xylocopa violacea TaxID=135666 RepID=A0ABP1P0S4_XYLVO